MEREKNCSSLSRVNLIVRKNLSFKDSICIYMRVCVCALGIRILFAILFLWIFFISFHSIQSFAFFYLVQFVFHNKHTNRFSHLFFISFLSDFFPLFCVFVCTFSDLCMKLVQLQSMSFIIFGIAFSCDQRTKTRTHTHLYK